MNVVPSNGVNWGFSGSDIFSNANTIVGSLAAFVLLAVCLFLVPPIIHVIYVAIANISEFGISGGLEETRAEIGQWYEERFRGR